MALPPPEDRARGPNTRAIARRMPATITPRRNFTESNSIKPLRGSALRLSQYRFPPLPGKAAGRSEAPWPALDGACETERRGPAARAPARWAERGEPRGASRSDADPSPEGAGRGAPPLTRFAAPR